MDSGCDEACSGKSMPTDRLTHEQMCKQGGDEEGAGLLERNLSWKKYPGPSARFVDEQCNPQGRVFQGECENGAAAGYPWPKPA